MMNQGAFKEVNKIRNESDDGESSDEKSGIDDAKSSVFVKSNKIPENTDVVEGMNFEKEINLHEFVNQYKYMGFQATNLGIGIDEVNKMIHFKYAEEGDGTEDDQGLDSDSKHEALPKKKKCLIWLSFTSNMISSGLREIFVYLAKKKFIDVVVTTAGGVEEDIIKCFSKTYLGDFNLNGKKLRKKGWNRIGNLIVPNDNYCKFEDWLQPILNKMLHEQNRKNEELFLKKLDKQRRRREQEEKKASSSHPSSNLPCDSSDEDESDLFYLSPSEFIKKLGEEINDENSLIYWCHKNDIPVFCPGLTDGSLGDNLFFHNYGNKIKNNLILDIVKDIKKINSLALNCKKSGIIILGGGLPKHHVCNANLMRNGADFAVYVNTANEYDGSDSGANTTEALSWGKIKAGHTNNHVKVFGDATILFPLMVLNTFYLHDRRGKQREGEAGTHIST
ncbi:deoxyhypusine synthase, putative [Plasmodium knowlesi strain H]|uniref:Deoxyhypusine synthase, putative n=3 Tax=Plasmodium knowlesi TaxID=5850 RepID=A0A5K1UEP9_PLAKH|nr:deoxyhypusine synthase, putative [Plasmodium knowlesi strain H]OTN67822.1 putative Deoxyhypusine synthase [Plasmodium knowlesi]CAA9990482.1 deoxyhypusine synthase, putative [Plasmodium knowlesi strain H]SBO19700.1 deoxyhypusine synthase, putative [Plasmodium knowlesi strain H]SBO22481.1 deoxyhypusine synthase, putative [Plasmodium knowlesi strain H]VVS79956.1 deoxyhypusine synthase, putative [Plasmodium knowlesi strain H]|eukprot:XP_002260871.1 deoxyhypusine synthase, putative [Plasmodium knowlesi strain H]